MARSDRPSPLKSPAASASPKNAPVRGPYAVLDSENVRALSVRNPAAEP
jgi:hypothetical protein